MIHALLAAVDDQPRSRWELAARCLLGCPTVAAVHTAMKRLHDERLLAREGEKCVISPAGRTALTRAKADQAPSRPVCS